MIVNWKDFRGFLEPQHAILDSDLVLVVIGLVIGLEAQTPQVSRPIQVDRLDFYKKTLTFSS